METILLFSDGKKKTVVIRFIVTGEWCKGCQRKQESDFHHYEHKEKKCREKEKTSSQDHLPIVAAAASCCYSCRGY
jgi:hypothetical protein